MPELNYVICRTTLGRGKEMSVKAGQTEWHCKGCGKPIRECRISVTVYGKEQKDVTEAFMFGVLDEYLDEDIRVPTTAESSNAMKRYQLGRTWVQSGNVLVEDVEYVSKDEEDG